METDTCAGPRQLGSEQCAACGGTTRSRKRSQICCESCTAASRPKPGRMIANLSPPTLKMEWVRIPNKDSTKDTKSFSSTSPTEWPLCKLKRFMLSTSAYNKIQPGSCVGVLPSLALSARNCLNDARLIAPVRGSRSIVLSLGVMVRSNQRMAGNRGPYYRLRALNEKAVARIQASYRIALHHRFLPQEAQYALHPRMGHHVAPV